MAKSVSPQTTRMLRDMAERLGDLEGALKTIATPGFRPNGVPFQGPPPPPQANPMAGVMMEQMLGALDASSQGQMRSLWGAMQGGQSPQAMAQACEPIIAKLAPQDQATARMMMGMMMGQGGQPAAAPSANGGSSAAPPPQPAAPSPPPPTAPDLASKMEKVAERAEAAMQEAQRAHAELATVRHQVAQVIGVVDGPRVAGPRQ
jgi:hypothetical protein